MCVCVYVCVCVSLLPGVFSFSLHPFWFTQVTSEQAVEQLEKLKPDMDFADVEELMQTGACGGVAVGCVVVEPWVHHDQ